MTVKQQSHQSKIRPNFELYDDDRSSIDFKSAMIDFENPTDSHPYGLLILIIVILPVFAEHIMFDTQYEI